jgi:hypothetical protein
MNGKDEGRPNSHRDAPKDACLQKHGKFVRAIPANSKQFKPFSESGEI